MTARRRLLVSASVLASLGALTACEKPAPIVTIVNEGRSTYAEAGRWCFEGQTGDECATRESGETNLEVLPGTLGIDVAKDLAKGRWIATLVDKTNPQQVLVDSGVLSEDHYYSFDLPQLPPRTELLLTVRALAEGGDEQSAATEEARGTWQFELTPRD